MSFPDESISHNSLFYAQWFIIIFLKKSFFHVPVERHLEFYQRSVLGLLQTYMFDKFLNTHLQWFIPKSVKYCRQTIFKKFLIFKEFLILSYNSQKFCAEKQHINLVIYFWTWICYIIVWCIATLLHYSMMYCYICYIIDPILRFFRKIF